MTMFRDRAGLPGARSATARSLVSPQAANRGDEIQFRASTRKASGRVPAGELLSHHASKVAGSQPPSSQGRPPLIHQSNAAGLVLPGHVRKAGVERHRTPSPLAIHSAGPLPLPHDGGLIECDPASVPSAHHPTPSNLSRAFSCQGVRLRDLKPIKSASLHANQLRRGGLYRDGNCAAEAGKFTAGDGNAAR